MASFEECEETFETREGKDVIEPREKSKPCSPTPELPYAMVRKLSNELLQAARGNAKGLTTMDKTLCLCAAHISTMMLAGEAVDAMLSIIHEIRDEVLLAKDFGEARSQLHFPFIRDSF